MYLPVGTRVVALDPVSGAEIWSYALPAMERLLHEALPIGRATSRILRASYLLPGRS